VIRQSGQQRSVTIQRGRRVGPRQVTDWWNKTYEKDHVVALRSPFSRVKAAAWRQRHDARATSMQLQSRNWRPEEKRPACSGRSTRTFFAPGLRLRSTVSVDIGEMLMANGECSRGRTPRVTRDPKLAPDSDRNASGGLLLADPHGTSTFREFPGSEDCDIETMEPETSETRDWRLAMSRGEISRAETGDYPGRAQKLRPAIASRDWRFASRRLVSIDSSGRRTSGLPPTIGPSQLNPGYSPGLSLRNRCYQTGDQRKQIF
jgi:hypothetical protein